MNQACKRMSQEFVLLERKKVISRQMGDGITIFTTSDSSRRKPHARLSVGVPVMRKLSDLGLKDIYVQVYLSPIAIKLATCAPDAPGARFLGNSKQVAVNELLSMWDLPAKFRCRCVADVVIRENGADIVATFPPELRDHIDKINGVAR